jgi:hypothetical protein
MAKTEHTQGAPSTSPGAPAYVERPVERDADFLFSQGAEVFELLSPEDRKIYVMQSYSLSGTPELSHNDLFSLGNRLEFPEGWRYRVHTLDRDLISSARGATIQDEFGNIYQLVE